MRRTIAPLLAALVALVGIAVLPRGAEAAVGNPPIGSPVHAQSFPDPEVIFEGGAYWAFGTDGPLGDLQLLRSTNLVDWVGRPNALGTTPAWAQANDVWAPAVGKFGTRWHAYVTFRQKVSGGKRCVALAVSDDIDGPYNGLGNPVVCNDAEGGVIDPALYWDGATTFLVWKTEGVVGSIPPAIWSAPLAGDGSFLAAPGTRILSSSQPWEGSLIENPSMVQAGGRLYLFYSGNEYQSTNYATGWAVCDTPIGPCVTPPNRTILATESDTLKGPGGASVFRDETGATWLAFHAWTTPSTSDASGRRSMFLRRLDFVDGRPVPAGSSPRTTVRVAGANRFATSAAFSANSVQALRPVTYVATGEAFPDVLAAGPASGSEDSPVLLVQRDNIPSEVAAELGRVKPGHIVVMGGTNAISTGVENQLRSFTPGLHRESGVNRFHTAALVSRNTFPVGVAVTYIATGDAFPDALAAGAAGAANRAPLLLVQRDGIPVDTRTELQRLRPGRIVVIGGAGAVSEGTLDQLRAYSGNVSRIAGGTRYETAALVAEREFGGLIGGVVIATGENFADAVAAGAAGYPILLVPSGNAPAPGRVKAALDALRPLGVVVVGGEGAVGSSTLASLGL